MCQKTLTPSALTVAFGQPDVLFADPAINTVSTTTATASVPTVGGLAGFLDTIAPAGGYTLPGVRDLYDALAGVLYPDLNAPDRDVIERRSSGIVVATVVGLLLGGGVYYLADRY